MLVFPVLIYFSNMIILHSHVLRKLLDFPNLIVLLIGSSLPLFLPVIITFAFSCDMTPSQNKSLKHVVTSILVPKRSRWACREALYSLATPGHLLHLNSFLNYRHIIEYLLYVRQAINPSHRGHLSSLWNDTLRIKWGPFYRLRNAAKNFAFTFEDPFVLLIHNTAYSVDEPLDYLNHRVRDSYRQHLLSQAALRRHGCQGKTKHVHIQLTRSLYLTQTQPLHQTLLRQILTGSVDHTSRLFKSNLTSSPLCPFCNSLDETAKRIFWDCQRWHSVRTNYPQLLKLFHLVGSQWPNCSLHCGWIEQDRNYGLDLLEGLHIPYDLTSFVRDTHKMYLDILFVRHAATQVLHTIPHTPTDIPFTPHSVISSPPISPHLVQFRGDVSPISFRSSGSG